MKKLVPKLSRVCTLECESNQLGKHHCVLIHLESIKESVIFLSLLNLIVWSVSKYFIAFVDNYSLTTCLYLIAILKSFLFLKSFVLKWNPNWYLCASLRIYKKQIILVLLLEISCHILNYSQVILFIHTQA